MALATYAGTCLPGSFKPMYNLPIFMLHAGKMHSVCQMLSLNGYGFLKKKALFVLV